MIFNGRQGGGFSSVELPPCFYLLGCSILRALGGVRVGSSGFDSFEKAGVRMMCNISLVVRGVSGEFKNSAPSHLPPSFRPMLIPPELFLLASLRTDI